MIGKLTIKNIALIDYAEIDFGKQLNVLSGETGAGKSVILDSINFVLGAKADKTMIRHGEDSCLVCCTFTAYSDAVKQILDQFDIEHDGELVIKRKFDVNGNGYIKLNGESITSTMLRKITSLLVDVHGQSEHYALLNKAKQLECLDNCEREEISCVKAELAPLIASLKSVENELNTYGGSEVERARRIDLLKYQINEITTAKLKENEEEQLVETRNRLMNLEKITQALGAASALLTDDGGALDIVLDAAQGMKGISGISEDYNRIYERLCGVKEEIEDIGESIQDMFDSLDGEDVNVDELEVRLETYRMLKKKYGSDLSEIIKYAENAANEYDNLINYDQLTQKLRKTRDELREKIYGVCVKLSEKRKAIANKFCKNVTEKLRQLSMPSAVFEIDFAQLPSLEECDNFSENGLDRIEFEFSANAGEPLKPLSKIISGGEMSRFMLALKTKAHSECETYIFDEIDAGISGITAGVIAENFAEIAKNKQIIAISHLPHIIAMSDNSFLIEKHEDEGKTHTQVNELKGDGKVCEVVRLIGGSIDDEAARLHAENMIAKANLFKQKV